MISWPYHSQSELYWNVPIPSLILKILSYFLILDQAQKRFYHFNRKEPLFPINFDLTFPIILQSKSLVYCLLHEDHFPILSFLV